MTSTTRRDVGWIQSPTVGIALFILAGLLIAIMDATGKYLTHDYAVIEVVWARFLFQLILLPLVIGRVAVRRTLASKRPFLQITRGALLLAGAVTFVTALHFIPQADASAIGKIGPLFVMALSVPLLGERVDARRWIAAVTGFGGAMLVIRPGFGMAHWALLLPLLAAFLFALYLLTTRVLSRFDSAATTYLYTAMVGVVVTSAAVPFVWRPPTLEGWILMVATGLLLGASNLSIIHGYRRAQATTLAPFHYLQLLWATIMGFLVFGDFPDVWTIVGATIIVLSGLFVIFRAESGVVERRRDRRRGRRNSSSPTAARPDVSDPH